MALLDTLTKRFASAAAEPAETGGVSLSVQVSQVNLWKQQSLARAHEMSAARAQAQAERLGRDLTQDEFNALGRTTLVDYYQACKQVGLENHLTKEQWNPRVFSDLSDQDISNFMLSDPKKGKAEIDKNYDGYDLDGDGQINMAAVNEFYDNVRLPENGRNFIVDPAGSFIDQITRMKLVENVTISNLRESETLPFGSGEYKDIRLTNIKGGEIQFNERSQVSDLSIDGVSASITMGENTSVSNLKVSDRFRIVDLQMGKGAMLCNANLEKASISMRSNLQGATLKKVQLSSNMEEVNLDNVTLHDVTIDGKHITSIDDLKQVVKIDPKAQVKVIASDEFAKAAKQAKLHEQLKKTGALETTKSWAVEQPVKAAAPAPEAPAIQSPVIEASRANAAEGLTNAPVGFNGNLMTADVMKLPKEPPLQPAQQKPLLTDADRIKHYVDQQKIELAVNERLGTLKAVPQQQRQAAASLPSLPGRRL